MTKLYWRSQVLSVVLRSVGLLLITSAGMKLLGIPTDPVAEVTFFREAWFGAALIQAELFLGLWLLVGVGQTGAWCSAIFIFSCFTLFSLVSAWSGRTTCGCFGKVQINPWYVFTLDLLILSLLLLVRPSLPFNIWAVARNSLVTRPLHFVFQFAALIFVVVALGASIRYASVSEGVRSLRAKFQGDAIVVVPGMVDLGEGEIGSKVTGWIELVNQTDHPVRVIGVSPDCMIKADTDLPLKLDVGQRRTIEIMIKLRVLGQTTRKSWFFLDDRGILQFVEFHATGRAVTSATVSRE